MKIINKIYNTPIFASIFHTLPYCLQRELRDCKTVLDIGCGPSSPLQHCKNIKQSLGVEAYKPYLEISKKHNIHNEYLNKKIEELEFPDKSFDAVIMIEVLEHLSEEEGLRILQKLEKWTKKKIIISSPNGFVPQKELDGNPLQKHLSGWDVKKMRSLGYRCSGLAGLKVLRQEVQSNSMMGGDILASIRFRPRLLWFIIAAFSQVFTYYIPYQAFELFNVKLLNKK